ncbi:hypothetical protein LCGC14_1337720 [marine sediment metagenome]|uniref:Uncharacterized protein n=1 Tax=marine sediment metagenome TaxID=412755 RepID=A0A0F9KEF5_9ZZZZ
MRAGCRIKWTHTYRLNVKHGVYYGCVEHTKRFQGSDQLAVVQFDRNKRTSRVPWIELELDNSE